MKRFPDCPPDHDDRLIHAVVLDVPSGKVIKAAEWYLHDHRRYLWPLGSGRFLLRKLNDLYVIDATLHEELVMLSPANLLWVTVTPDKKQIVVETKNPDFATGKGNESVEPKFLIQFLDVDSLSQHRTIKLNSLVNLEGTSAGYADSLQKGDQWLIRFGPDPAHRQNIARVRSRGAPQVFYSSNNSLLIGRPQLSGGDYSVSAFTVTGRRLWQQHWTQQRYSPVIVRSEDSGRFAVSSLIRKVLPARPSGSEADPNEDDVNGGIEQNIQILETASGQTLQSISVSRVNLGGQNFSLSPDGRQLAVLGESGIDLFALPQPAEDEQAKFSALKANVPGLYMPSSKTEATSSLEGNAATDTSSEDVAASFTRNTSLEPSAEGRDESDTADQTKSAEDSTFPTPSASPGLPGTATAPAAIAGTAVGSAPIATIRTTTREVVVDVVVTDGKGRAIKGLQQQDFQLAEDGRVQKLRYFREFNDAQTAKAPDAPATPAAAKAAPNVFTNNSTPDPASVTLVLLDLLNTPSADQQFARQQLVKFLRNKTENSQQLGLCTLSADQASHLRLIQGFTTDENQLLTAINGRKGTPKVARWQASASATQSTVSTVSDLARSDPRGWQGVLRGLEDMQAEQQGDDTDARVGITLDALSQLARYLSGVPGRKNLLWLSGSFPISISTNPALASRISRNHNYANNVKQVTNLLADGQIAVYPIDVRGLQVGSMSAATMGGIGPPSQGTPAAPGQLSRATSPTEDFQQQGMQELAMRSGEMNAMDQFAADTGGKAFYNSNGIALAIETAMDQGSNYYTLAYSPLNKNYDGKFRKIKVAMAQKGDHLHYRQGYFAEDPADPAKNANAARDIGVTAMQHGSPPSHQIHLTAQVVAVGQKRKVDSAKLRDILGSSKTMPSLPAMVEVQHYGIDFAVDSSDLLFLHTDKDIYHSSLHFVVASFDGEGRPLSGVSSVWESDLDAAAYKDVTVGGVHIHQEVDVPFAAAFLRLGIQDRPSNHLGTIEFPLPVPPPSDLPRVKHNLPEIEPD